MMPRRKKVAKRIAETGVAVVGKKDGALKRESIVPLWATPDFSPLEKYTPEWDKIVIREMSQGRSITHVARILGVGLTTFKRTVKRRPSLKAAVEFGTDASQSWWEEYGRMNLSNRFFNTALYQIQMRNRFGWSSGDRVMAAGRLGQDGSLQIAISKEEAAAG